MNYSKGSFVFLIMAVSITGVPAASAATCSNASINGTYGILSTGLDGSLQPATGINQVTVDGNGNATGVATKSLNGTIVQYTFTGTYQINKNCTGKAAWTNQDKQTEHDNIYLNSGNQGAFLIQTDSNHVQTSVAVAEGTATCSNAGVKHTYSFEFTGFYAVGQSAVAGQITLNGSGGATGLATFTLHGKINGPVPLSVTYQINSDCTGTAQITPKGLPAINLALVVVNADKEIMAVETDTGTIVSGTLQE